MNRQFLIISSALLVGCAAPRTTVRTSDGSGSVVFKVKPSNAHAVVDGKDVGEARNYDGVARVLQLPLGSHVIRVEAPGRASWETTVYLGDSQELVQVELPEEGK